MYCIQCGVHLADTEKSCPLCGTVCYHPDLPHPQAEPLYPKDQHFQNQVSSSGVMGALTALCLIPIIICLLCDLRVNGQLNWAGYVIGAIVLFYEIFLLPGWFRKPNPVIFVPCGFAAAALFLLYIDWFIDGGWFFPFALPVIAGICLIFTTMTVLLKYVKKGKLFIFGGCAMVLGVFAQAVEHLAVHNLESTASGWAVYPAITLLLLGAYLIFLGVCRPARESMRRKFFI